MNMMLNNRKCSAFIAYIEWTLYQIAAKIVSFVVECFFPFFHSFIACSESILCSFRCLLFWTEWKLNQLTSRLRCMHNSRSFSGLFAWTHDSMRLRFYFEFCSANTNVYSLDPIFSKKKRRSLSHIQLNKSLVNLFQSNDCRFMWKTFNCTGLWHTQHVLSLNVNFGECHFVT